MQAKQINQNTFLQMSRSEICEIVRRLNRPRVGIFVPDGNRRMTLSQSRQALDSDEFYRDYVKLTTGHFRQNLEIFFTHGLQTLLVPLISHSALERSETYLKNALLPGLEIILKSGAWLELYEQHDIRLKAYGNLKIFEKTLYASVLDWLDETIQKTAHHQTHRLYLGFASPPKMNEALCQMAIEHFKKHGQAPHHQQQVMAYYGESIPQADFFIMSTKFIGLGAIPPLIGGENTQLYFLAAPGVQALTEENYRRILYDFLFCRSVNNSIIYEEDASHRALLKEYFSKNQSKIFGLGQKIGGFWIPEI
jgi:hypothetical protein